MSQEKRTVYLLCDWVDKKTSECHGRLVDEGGSLLGSHYSSSFDWLRRDLTSKLPAHGPLESFEIIDLIGQAVPEIFPVGGQDQ